MSFAEDSYTPTPETKHMLKIKGLDFEEEGTYTNVVRLAAGKNYKGCPNKFVEGKGFREGDQ